MTDVDKTVGILGGMGPEATAAFFREVIRLTPAETDQEHLKIVVVNDPKIPDRTRHLLEGGESPAPLLVAAARDLQRMGADLIAIPCNTAHAYYREIRSAVRIPVLHIVKETVRRAADVLGEGTRRIGIMSTQATLQVNLYQPPLKRYGYDPVIPDAETQDLISAAIKVLKSQNGWERASEWLSTAAVALQKQGCGALLLACTELGLVPIRVRLPLLDSLKILAKATVDYSLAPSAVAGQATVD